MGGTKMENANPEAREEGKLVGRLRIQFFFLPHMNHLGGWGDLGGWVGRKEGEK